MRIDIALKRLQVLTSSYHVTIIAYHAMLTSTLKFKLTRLSDGSYDDVPG